MMYMSDFFGSVISLLEFYLSFVSEQTCIMLLLPVAG